MADLATELADDDLTRGYAAMTPEQAAADLNTKYRARNRASMTASEVLNSVDAGEYALLSADKNAALWDLLAIGDLNPFGIEATLMADIFDAGPNTIAALQAARVEPISRAEELGLGKVSASQIATIRAA